MAWQNNLREISIILYRLKRNFGLPAILKRQISCTQDITTGEITRTFAEYPINRVIILPAGISNSFVYDLAYIAAGKNFTEGGFFTKNLRWMIIDAKDLPSDLVLTNEDFIVFETRRYDIKELELAEHRCGWILKTIELAGSDSEVESSSSSSGSSSSGS